jgi:hypothetical protein
MRQITYKSDRWFFIYFHVLHLLSVRPQILCLMVSGGFESLPLRQMSCIPTTYVAYCSCAWFAL